MHEEPEAFDCSKDGMLRDFERHGHNGDAIVSNIDADVVVEAVVVVQQEAAGAAGDDKLRVGLLLRGEYRRLAGEYRIDTCALYQLGELATQLDREP
jgi:hypothetical protein